MHRDWFDWLATVRRDAPGRRARCPSPSREPARGGATVVSIYLVTGPPGTGKTWYCVRGIFNDLRRGDWVATNIELRDGWAHALASKDIITRLFKGKKGIEENQRRYEEHLFVSTSLGELMSVRLPECGRCKGCREHGKCNREGRGKIRLDEAHEWLNARKWEDDDREPVVKFASHHRKLGWEVYIITQDEKRIDNQVRGNFEYHVHLKNLKKFKLWGILPIFPVNVFVAVTTWHTSALDKVGITSYMINKMADYYDTMASPVMTDDDEIDVIRLPLTHEERDERRRGVWRTERQAELLAETAS